MAQNVKTVQGVAIASVKTAQGVAIASVKSILGVDNTGGGGPTLVISDDFTYSDGDIGAVSSAVWVVKSGAISIFTNRYTSSNASHSLAYHTTAVNANMRAESSFVVNGDTYGGAAVRVQSGADTGYVCFYDGTDLHLWTLSAGSETVITSAAVASVARIALEANGSGTSTRLKVQVDVGSGWVDQWTDQNPATDIDGGFAGISTYASAGTASFNDTFRAYNL